MRVIISGGSGLIGRELTKSLVAANHEVIIISRHPNTVSNLPVGVKTIGWNERALAENLGAADAIVNLAGASIAGESPLKMRWTPKRKIQILESRVDSGKMISEALRSTNKKPQVFIQSSAVGFYGPLTDEIVDENYPNGDDFLAKVCLEWEDSTKPVESLGIRRAVIRTGLVFSKQGGILPLLKLPYLLFVGGPLGNGKQYLSWIHMDDVINGIRFLMDTEGTQGIYNLSSPNPTTNKAFSKTLGKVMRRPSLVPVPSFAMKLALGEAATLALDGQRVVPKRLLEAGYNFTYQRLEDALTALLNPSIYI